MDSDDWSDLGDTTACMALGEKLGVAVVFIVLALVFFAIASSVRKDEVAQCNDSCSPNKGELIRRSAEHEALTCMCKWPDSSLHMPTPSPTEMIAP